MRRIALLVCIALNSTVTSAWANGRFPQSQRLLPDPNDSSRLFLASTFGLLTSTDGGSSWRYLCEQAFAKEVADGDPLLEVLSDGSVLSGISSSLNRSSDCGCSWETVAAADPNENLTDITQDANGRVLLLEYSTAAGDFSYRLSASSDLGRTFQALTHMPEFAYALTLDAAPSKPTRIYVSGYDDQGQGQLAISDDDGATFTYRPILGAGVDNQPYIAAVHPRDENVVFVRTSSIGGEGDQRDTLLVTRDGGVSWSPIMQQSAALLGFALSPTGDELLIGYGDRVDPALFVNVDALGIYRARFEEQVAFEKVYSGSVSCLRWTADGVYACFAQNHPDLPAQFALGFSADTSLSDAQPFTTILRYEDVQGPPACAAATCSQTWTTDTCMRLRAACDVEPSELSCGSTGGTSGTGGGSGAASGQGGAPTSGPSTKATEGDVDGGCACRSAGVSLAPRGVFGKAPIWAACVGLALASLGRVRRRLAVAKR